MWTYMDIYICIDKYMDSPMGESIYLSIRSHIHPYVSIYTPESVPPTHSEIGSITELVTSTTTARLQNCTAARFSMVLNILVFYYNLVLFRKKLPPARSHVRMPWHGMACQGMPWNTIP